MHKMAQALAVSLLLCVTLVLTPSLLFGQQTALQDVIYMTDGTIIKGVIIELVPSETVKIRSADGNIYVYKMSNVSRIAKEENFSQQALGQPGSMVRTGSRKNPTTALLLSAVLPGAGQVYNGQAGKGILQFGLAAGGWVAYVVFAEGVNYSSDGYYDPTWGWISYGGYEVTGNKYLSYGGLGVALAVSLWSALDAPAKAHQINKANGWAVVADRNDKVHLAITGIGSQDQMVPGLVVNFTF